MSLKEKAFEAKTITLWNGGGRIYTEPVPLVELEDAEEEIESLKRKHQTAENKWESHTGIIIEGKDKEIETAQSTITSQAIQLERKDKEIQTLVELLDIVFKSWEKCATDDEKHGIYKSDQWKILGKIEKLKKYE